MSTATCEEDAVIVVFVIDKDNNDAPTNTPLGLVPAVIVLPLIDSVPFATLEVIPLEPAAKPPNIVLPVTDMVPVELLLIPAFPDDGLVGFPLIVLEETIIDPVDVFTIPEAPAPAVPPIIVQEDKDITPEVLWAMP